MLIFILNEKNMDSKNAKIVFVSNVRVHTNLSVLWNSLFFLFTLYPWRLNSCEIMRISFISFHNKTNFIWRLSYIRENNVTWVSPLCDLYREILRLLLNNIKGRMMIDDDRFGERRMNNFSTVLYSKLIVCSWHRYIFCRSL